MQQAVGYCLSFVLQKHMEMMLLLVAQVLTRWWLSVKWRCMLKYVWDVSKRITYCTYTNSNICDKHFH